MLIVEYIKNMCMSVAVFRRRKKAAQLLRRSMSGMRDGGKATLRQMAAAAASHFELSHFLKRYVLKVEIPQVKVVVHDRFLCALLYKSSELLGANTFLLPVVLSRSFTEVMRNPNL